MNLLSSLLKYTADQIAALRAKNTTQDSTVSGIDTRLTTAEGKVANVEAQLATAISAVTVDSEVQNIRVGDDGVTYDTAGNAVRNQFSDLKADSDNLASNITNDVEVLNANISGFTSGRISSSTIGSAIGFDSQSNVYHYHIDVREGERYTIKIRKSADTLYNVVFTDNSDVVIGRTMQGTGTMVTVTNTVVVPSGATRMYVASQTSNLPQSTYNTIVKQVFNDAIERQNLLDGYGFTLEKGYWSNAGMSSLGGNDATWVSFKTYLSAGTYCLSFGKTVRCIRRILDGTFNDSSITIDAPYVFTTATDGYVGFSFRDYTQGSTEVAWNSWVQIEDGNTTIGYYMDSAVDVKARKALNSVYEKLSAFPTEPTNTKHNDIVIGMLSYGAIVSHKNSSNQDDRFCTKTFYPVKKGDLVLLNDDAYMMGIAEYTAPSESAYIAIHTWYQIAPKDGTMKPLPYVVQNDGYVRMHFGFYGNLAVDITNVDAIATIIHLSRHDAYRIGALYGVENALNIKKPKSITLNGDLVIGQDGTFIDGLLWAFQDGASALGNIQVINVDSGNLEEVRTHNLGHANSVDYNANNDCLIAFYTLNHNPHLLIYSNPASKESLLTTDSNCMIIPLYDSDTSMSPTASLCWGEADNLVYYMDGVYSSYDGDTGVLAESISVHKILLGMGDNDLSADGYGTFVSGKANTEYNGTCKILKSYTGEFQAGIDIIRNQNSLQTVQGMEYDGYLYVGWGTRGHNFVRVQLDDTNNTYWADYNYMYHKYDYTHTTETLYEPELLALKGNKIYCGSYYSGLSMLLEFER